MQARVLAQSWKTRLVPGMMVVGDRFKRNEIFVPEMLIAARAMKEAL